MSTRTLSGTRIHMCIGSTTDDDQRTNEGRHGGPLPSWLGCLTMIRSRRSTIVLVLILVSWKSILINLSSALHHDFYCLSNYMNLISLLAIELSNLFIN